MTALVWVFALLVVGLAVMVLEVFVPSGGVLGLLSVVAIGAAVHEPLWKVADSQFLVIDDGAIERTASRGLRDGCFVNASGTPDPDGAFIELAVPSFNTIGLRTIILPRRAVERSPAGRRLRIAATSPARL